MASLSKDDAAFLRTHGISLLHTFDASGMNAREWKSQMREQGKFVAYGVSCLRGHSLKTRAGNCIQCNTANIAFARRSGKGGFVYIASSKAENIIKVGFSAEDPDNRIYIANIEGYAGATDWRVDTRAALENAGRVELDVHLSLEKYTDPREWVRNGQVRIAREVYNCSLARARSVLASHSSLSSHAPEIRF